MVVNDVQSQLNATRVHAIVAPSNLDELQSAVLGAKSSGRSIAIAGGRNSMGGQQFGAGAVLIDTRGLDLVLAFDRGNGSVTVEGGIQWPTLLDFLDTEQRGQPRQWGIHQKQTGADRLTLGGTLSCNAHGRGLRLPPIVDQVESIDLMNSAGDLVTCSRKQHRDLFSLAIGGYGLFGIITRVVLRLRPRCKVRRTVSVTDATGLMERMVDRIRDGFEYGDFQFAIDPNDESFLRRGVFSCYKPVSDDTPLTKDPIRFSEKDWLSLAIEAHRDKRRAFERYSAAYLRTSGQIYCSDTQQRNPYLDDYHVDIDRAVGGGFNGSSQHLKKREELRWRQAGADGRIDLYVRPCVHPVVRRWDAASICRGSGRKSLAVCRARRRPWPLACPPLSGRAGFANVVACHLSISVPCRGVIYRS